MPPMLVIKRRMNTIIEEERKNNLVKGIRPPDIT
jgi:hypothetical protein